MTFGCYPRDDVFYSWVKDGLLREGTATISILRDDGTQEKLTEIRLGQIPGFHPEGSNGDRFAVDIDARFDSQVFHRRVTFAATSDESDVYLAAVGPGAVPVTGKGLFKKTRYSGFVFGVLVMGATTQDGTRVVGRIGALIVHGPDDGMANPRLS